MRHEGYRRFPCALARGLDTVARPWTVLNLCEALGGLTRFDQFEKSLGISPAMLTRRLSELVQAGLMERRRYSERPPRDEYVLTDPGRAFMPVLRSLRRWSEAHFPDPKRQR